MELVADGIAKLLLILMYGMRRRRLCLVFVLFGEEMEMFLFVLVELLTYFSSWRI